MAELVLIAMLLSVLIFAVPQKLKWPLAMLITSVVAGAFFVVGLKVLITGVGLSFDALSLPLIMGGEVKIDMLSAFFIVMVSLAVFSMVLYSRGYVRKYLSVKPPLQITIHYFSMMQLFFSILLILMLRDWLGFLFSWELMTISSFLLVMFFGEKRSTRKASMNYLLMMHIGLAALLSGFIMLHNAGLPATLDSLAAYFANNNSMPLFLVFLLGFGLKAGIFLLHVWLPEADPAAPAHISGFMSGAMTKMGVYGLLRVVSAIPDGSMEIGLILFIAGIATGIWGVVLAVLQGDIRRQLAYSTMENIGIIVAAIGFGLIAKSQGFNTVALMAFGGAILHVAGHCFGKMILFMGAGNIYTAAGTNKIDSLGGLNRKMPLTSVLFFTGMLSLCALPPLAGFISEFVILLGMLKGIGGTGMMSIVSICGLLFMALTGGMVIIVFTKLYGVAFLGRPRSKKAERASEVGIGRLSAISVMLAAILLIGIFPVKFFEVAVSVADSVFGSHSAFAVSSLFSRGIHTLTYAVLFLVFFVVVLWGLRKYVMSNRIQAKSPVWMCGFPAVTPKMQYTGESYSEGLSRVSDRFIKNTGEAEYLATDEIFPAPHKFDVGHADKMGDLFAEWWVRILRMVNARFTRISSGKVNHYIFFALLYLLLIFFLTVFNII